MATVSGKCDAVHDVGPLALPPCHKVDAALVTGDDASVRKAMVATD